jgi:hypothetical protein
MSDEESSPVDAHAAPISAAHLRPGLDPPWPPGTKWTFGATCKECLADPERPNVSGGVSFTSEQAMPDESEMRRLLTEQLRKRGCKHEVTTIRWIDEGGMPLDGEARSKRFLSGLQPQTRGKPS